MFERLGGALHAALQFVDVKTRRGHNALPSFSKPTANTTRPADRCELQVSAGDNRTVAGTAQDRTNRTRLGDREYDDRQRSLAGKRECGRVHHLVATFDRLRMRQAVETPGGRVCL